MKRLLIVLACSLVLGLSAAVGLAWVRSAMMYPAMSDNTLLAHEQGQHGAHEGVSVHEYRTTGSTQRNLGMRYFNAWSSEQGDPISLPAWSAAKDGSMGEGGRYTMVIEKEFGWPLRCMRVSWAYEDKETAFAGEGLRGGVTIEPVDWGVSPSYVIGQPDFDYVETESHRAAPMVPIWGALAANTALFSAPWLLLACVLGVPRWLVSRRRRRRGRCVKCAYTLPEGGGCCPECGAEKSARRPWFGALNIAMLTTASMLAVGATVGFVVWRAHGVVHMPAFHTAAAQGDAAALRQMIDAGHPVDAPLDGSLRLPGYDLWEARPLAWASARGHVEAVRVLLDAGASIDADEQKALMLAAENGRAEVCRVLIDAGADASYSSHRSSSVMVMATYSGDNETIRVIRDATQGDERDREILLSAIYKEEIVLREALETYDWPQEDLDATLWSAVRSCGISTDIDVVRTLIAHGADAANDRFAFVWEAAERGDAELVRVMLEAGGSATRAHGVAKGWTPLRRAVLRECRECFELIYAAGGDPFVTDDRGETLLHAAAGDEGSGALIERLVEVGLDVNRADHSGKTPIVKAVVYGDLEGVETLLRLGADPLRADLEGNTPLDYARGGISFAGGFGIYQSIDAASDGIIAALERASASVE